MKRSIVLAMVLGTLALAADGAAAVTYPATNATGSVPGRFVANQTHWAATHDAGSSVHNASCGGCCEAEKSCCKGIWDGFCSERRGCHGFSLPAIKMPGVCFRPIGCMPRRTACRDKCKPCRPEMPCIDPCLRARFDECRTRLNGWVRGMAGCFCQDCCQGEVIGRQPTEATEVPTEADPQLDSPQPAPPADAEARLLPDYQADTSASTSRSAKYWLLPPLWPGR